MLGTALIARNPARGARAAVSQSSGAPSNLLIMCTREPCVETHISPDRGEPKEGAERNKSVSVGLQVACEAVAWPTQRGVIAEQRSEFKWVPDGWSSVSHPIH